MFQQKLTFRFIMGVQTGADIFLQFQLAHIRTCKGDVSNSDNHPSIISIKQHIAEKNKIFFSETLLKKKFLLRLRH